MKHFLSIFLLHACYSLLLFTVSAVAILLFDRAYQQCLRLDAARKFMHQRC